MSFEPKILEFGLRLLAALTFGALIGLERQWRRRRAGMRTNALVALGASGFTLFSTLVDGDTSPTRVAAQVVSGIGFLGAGVIMREGLNVRGLNTAATLWCAAAAGLLAGIGQYAEAIVLASLVVGTNLVLRPMAEFISGWVPLAEGEEPLFELTVECDILEEHAVRDWIFAYFEEHLWVVRRSETARVRRDERLVRLRFQVLSHGRARDAERFDVQGVAGLSGVKNVRWEAIDDE